jgi:hypothetical protein
VAAVLELAAFLATGDLDAGRAANDDSTDYSANYDDPDWSLLVAD